jgi:dTDP-4-amino-4,6-dideoxygalactose transaminase
VNDNGKSPLVDLITPNQELEGELIAVFRAALKTARFAGSPAVEAFDRQFAQFCGTGHCVGVGSDTEALRFALLASGVNLGDTIVTVPNTFIATAAAISQAGARPDFVGVDDRTHNMDPTRLRE